MRPTLALRTLPLALALLLTPALAQTQPASRITAPISDEVRTTLHGNTHPLAQPQYDRGEAPSETPSGRMLLLLRRSSAQQSALHHYLDQLQDPASPHYRQWLTPQSYGEAYGISDADLAQVTGWLQQQGFRIERFSASRSLIVFSGSTANLSRAFHTSIHRYLIHGQEHLANNADPQIPSALAPVIAGISPMNDFRAQPQLRRALGGVWDPATQRIQPTLTLQGGTTANPIDYLYVDPADAATLCNTPNSQLNRNYSAAKSLDGTGVTLGILGYSQLVLDDVRNYRDALLNDTNPAHLPQDIVDGTSAGVLTGGYAVEALLDNEIAGALAPGAAINYYEAASTYLADGLNLAALRALDDNQVSILSASYGNCEANLGVSGNLLYSELWQQAAAQGITVVVSTGDSGSAACDNDNTEQRATQGLAVSGLASTPYNLSVGGTDFLGLTSSFSTYVQTTGGNPPYYGTALGPIPESTWNDSVVSNGTLQQNTAYSYDNLTNIVAGAGGVSSSVYCSAGTGADGSCLGALSGYPKPAFQQGLTPADLHRDLPDVALFAAAGKNNAAWVLCSDNNTDGDTSQGYTNCVTSNGVFNSSTNFDGIGGTSASTPAFAGILALVSQSLGGVRLGQAANVLYNLAASSARSTIFHTVEGNNSVPCSAGSPDCGANGFLTGYNTAPVYSEAAGLGSLNVSSLVAAWPSVSFTSTSTALTAGTSAGSLSTAALSVTHGTPLYFAASVTPSDATGSISVTNTSGVQSNAASSDDEATLGSNGKAAFSANNLPGGTYTLSAYYQGDATHSAGASNSIRVTVAPEPSTTVLTLQAIDPATGLPVSGNSVPYGFYSFLSAQTYGDHSTRDSHGNLVPDGVATGAIQFQGSPGAAQANLDSTGVASVSLTQSAAGSYSVQAQYGGDPSLNPNNSPTLALTITPSQPTLSLTQSANSVSSDSTLTVNAILTADSIGNYPNADDITLTSNGISFFRYLLVDGVSLTGTIQVVYTFQVNASQLAIGANTLTVNFAGDGYYGPATATTTVTVTAAPASFTLSGPANPITIPSPGASGTGTITLTPANGFTGSVALSCSITAIGNGPAPTCSVPASVTVTGTASASATLTVSTTAGSASNSLPLKNFFTPGGGIALGCMLLLTRLPRSRRKTWPSLLALALLLTGAGLSGCGGGGSGGGGGGGTPGTPAGAYTVTVTGTGGSLSASTKVPVTLQ